MSEMSDRTPFTYILVLPNSSSERKGGEDKVKGDRIESLPISPPSEKCRSFEAVSTRWLQAQVLK